MSFNQHQAPKKHSCRKQTPLLIIFFPFFTSPDSRGLAINSGENTKVKGAFEVHGRDLPGGDGRGGSRGAVAAAGGGGHGSARGDDVVGKAAAAACRSFSSRPG